MKQILTLLVILVFSLQGLCEKDLDAQPSEEVKPNSIRVLANLDEIKKLSIRLRIQEGRLVALQGNKEKAAVDVQIRESNLLAILSTENGLVPGQTYTLKLLLKDSKGKTLVYGLSEAVFPDKDAIKMNLLPPIGGVAKVDYGVLVFYFLLMLTIGIYFIRFIKNSKDYFKAGSKLPWWAAGISAWMGTFSAFVFVGAAGIGYREGMRGLLTCVFPSISLAIGAKFLAERWRRSGLPTPFSYLETRFNVFIRQFFSWLRIPYSVIDDGIRTYSLSLFFSIAVGLDLKVSIILSGGITLFYTLLGGLWAVIVTDVMQAIILMVGAIIVFPLSIHFAGGVSTFFERLPQGFLSPISEAYPTTTMIAFFFLFFFSYNGGINAPQRFLGVYDDKEAKKAGYLMAILNLLTPVIFIVPAWVARIKFPNLNVSPIEAEKCYVLLCMELLPSGLIGIVLAAMFSATMSAISTDANLIAGILTEDVYHRLVERNATEKRLIFLGRISTIIFCSGVTAMAFYIANFGAFDSLMKFFSLMVPPTLIPFLFGLLYRRATAWSAFTACFFGLAVGFLGEYFFPAEAVIFGITFKKFGMLSFSTSIITLIVFFSFDRIKGLTDEAKAKVDNYFRLITTPMEPSVRLALIAESKREGISPHFIVGILTAVVGIGMIMLGLFAGKEGMAINLLCGVILTIIGAVLYFMSKKTVPTSQGK